MLRPNCFTCKFFLWLFLSSSLLDALVSPHKYWHCNLYNDDVKLSHRCVLFINYKYSFNLQRIKMHISKEKNSKKFSQYPPKLRKGYSSHACLTSIPPKIFSRPQTYNLATCLQISQPSLLASTSSTCRSRCLCLTRSYLLSCTNFQAIRHCLQDRLTTENHCRPSMTE